ncbi:hypothetical protein J1614_005370 [Plenodomus biglobosus]|nr:hypothetical protein J1614_005370 [Plenodomus biglobosus]
MDRRKLNRTDESTTSQVPITDSLKSLIMNTFGESAGYYIFGDEEQRLARPETILQRMLSTRTAISTASSLAQANQCAQDDPDLQRFIQIGKGQCGTVYALRGTTSVVKLANSADKVTELYEDFAMHVKVWKAFPVESGLSDNIRIPHPETWVQPTTTEFWDQKKALFPPTTVVPSFGLLSKRIFPVPYPVKEALVDALCPKAIKEEKNHFLSQTENKDCLIRLYLGRRHDTRNSEPRNVGLRNFPLHVDEMERLGLNTTFYAKVMAQSLAIMHWRAGVDANDVEFVLGGSPQIVKLPTFEQIKSRDPTTINEYCAYDFTRRSISMWLLDFDQCKTFTNDEDGMKRLVRGFWFNDPYYPRPNASTNSDQRLWKVFAEHYLEISVELVEDQSRPKRFIEGVVEMGKARKKGACLDDGFIMMP